MRYFWTLLLLAAGLLGSGCQKASDEVPSATDTTAMLTPGAEQPFSLEAIARGAALYQEHCAQCHGPEGQGHPDWQNPAVVAAPPLNGTGNDWKRSRKDLTEIVKNGVKRKDEAVMPGWKERLSDQEIGDIITWFQALWPADVYERWRKANAQPASPKG